MNKGAIIEELAIPVKEIEKQKKLELFDDDLTDTTAWVWSEVPDEDDELMLMLGRDDESLVDFCDAMQFDNIAQAIEYRRYLDNEPVFLGLTLTLVAKEV